MEVAMDTDFNSQDMKKTSVSKRGLTEVEDGELVEDSNMTDVTATEEEKKILRAKRFGPVEVSNLNSKDPRIQRLYRRLKVNNETRLEALYLYGTDHLKTEDIFSLFSDYSPASVEWLTDKNCIAMWLDQQSCAQAMLHCTYRIKGQTPDESDDSEGESINKEDIRCAMPPGGIWRRGPASQLAPNLLVRFATYSDRKRNRMQHNDFFNRNIVFLDEGDEGAKKFRPESGNPWVDIAKEWSYFEMTAAKNKKQDDRFSIRDARQLLSKTENKLPEKILKTRRSSLVYNLDEEDLEEIPRNSIISGLKMQADIEEKKILSRKLMSKSSGSSKVDLRQRLSRKRRTTDDLEEALIDVEDKSYRLPHKRKAYEDVKWRQNDSDESEIEEDINQESASKDLRSKLKKPSKSRKQSKKRSSREREHRQKSVVVTKSRKKFVPDCPLQIEIDNDIYFNRINKNE